MGKLGTSVCHSFGWKPYIGELLGSLEYGKGFWEIVRWVKVQPLTIIVLVNQTCNWDFGLACCGDLYWRRILEKNVLETCIGEEDCIGEGDYMEERESPSNWYWRKLCYFKFIGGGTVVDPIKSVCCTIAVAWLKLARG